MPRWRMPGAWSSTSRTHPMEWPRPHSGAAKAVGRAAAAPPAERRCRRACLGAPPRETRSAVSCPARPIRPASPREEGADRAPRPAPPAGRAAPGGHALVRRLVQAAFAALLIVGVVAGPVSARTAPPASIVDTAIAVNAQTGEFSTLVAALLAADPAVIARLSRTGQVTVFAPTDAAFAKLGLDASNVGSLPRATLTKILLYHAAPGAPDAGGVVSSTRIRTLEGWCLRVSLSGGNAFVNDSKIVATNIRTTNGIIHVIDTVLLP